MAGDAADNTPTLKVGRISRREIIGEPSSKQGTAREEVSGS